ncbi:structural maintenance of chromosomes protein 4-like [Cydia amplana]|uniref:structural maintenance of chromosomes protein 4-like n=1 Tax=Cydia amplana TaxID=1869771 RepID=UPI002FE5B037
MDSTTNTENFNIDLKTSQENILLEIIKEVCSDPNSKISSKLIGKVNRIIADCDLSHYSSLHKLSTVDESTSTLLGLMNQTTRELSYDEQSELMQAISAKIQGKLPAYIAELEQLKRTSLSSKDARKQKIQELQESLDEKVNTLQEQESEKVELMMEWLNHRLHDATKFSESSTELLTLKTRSLELKSKILHLQILQNIFTETSQSIRAYSELHKDLKDNVKDAETRIKKYREIIDSDFKMGANK